MDAPERGSAPVADERPVLVRETGPRLVDRPLPAGRRRSGLGLRRAVLAGVAVGALLAAGLGGWLATRGDDAVTTGGGPAAAPAPPAALSVHATAPTGVVAGTAAAIEVRYADGAGTFSGSTEEWGDGVGASSLEDGRCGSSAADAASSGTYQARHTWAEPGTYTVRVAVSSYTCAGGAPVAEEASTTVTVVVAAP